MPSLLFPCATEVRTRVPPALAPARAAPKAFQVRLVGTVATGCQTMVLYRCGTALRILIFSEPAPRCCAFDAYAGGARRPCQDSVMNPGEIAIWIACVMSPRCQVQPGPPHSLPLYFSVRSSLPAAEVQDLPGPPAPRAPPAPPVPPDRDRDQDRVVWTSARLLPSSVPSIA
jgi:hypothetical protein